jgi:uncharacterized protein with PQ loop repeat
MPRLLTIWLDICLLRAGPQDLPVSQVLLVLTLTSYLLISMLLSLPGYPALTSLQIAVTDLGLLIVFAGSVLYLTGNMARINQTLSALAGAGTLLGLLALPLVHSLYQAQDAEQVSMPVLMFWLLLMGWNLLVMAHIIRHALSVILPIAVGIAVLYTLVAMQLITALFPQTN